MANDPTYTSVHILPATPGQTINVAQVAADILNSGGAPAGQTRVIFLPILPIPPSFGVNAAAALNFSVNVGRAVLHFYGLDWGRQDNLNVAANVISQTIVAPGRSFDLAAVAGPLTRAGGYIKGQDAVSKDDVTGANGGVNQIASAVLAAAYDAGLPIVRRVHYPYLNAFAPPGLDAMVTYTRDKRRKNSPDLVFRNTTGHPILVMTSNDGAGGVGVYIFNAAGYAPSHTSGSYTSTTSAPQVTLNPDGSVNTTITRSVSAGSHSSSDAITSHVRPIDP
jgi:vancomycin resistance protein YoaR